MSGGGSPFRNTRRTEDWVAAGAIASGVAPELRRPLWQLRDELAGVIEDLDRHMTESKGPDPYPWDATKALREKLAEAYFHSREVTRLAGCLADAIGHGSSLPELVEIKDIVESALALTRARISADTELFVDYGETGAVRAASGRLVLALSQLILASAESARGVAGAAIAIQTRSEQAPGESARVTISIADSGAGCSEQAKAAEAWVAEVAADAGGSFAATAEAGMGTAFELTLPSANQR